MTKEQALSLNKGDEVNYLNTDNVYVGTQNLRNNGIYKVEEILHAGPYVSIALEDFPNLAFSPCFFEKVNWQLIPANEVSNNLWVDWDNKNDNFIVHFNKMGMKENFTIHGSELKKLICFLKQFKKAYEEQITTKI